MMHPCSRYAFKICRRIYESTFKIKRPEPKSSNTIIKSMCICKAHTCCSMTDKPGLVSTGTANTCGQYNAECSRAAKYGYYKELNTAKTSVKAYAGCVKVLGAAFTCG